ncbi:hypothetical protein BEL04_02855 [Mucilaginibacter sp. PPCGB 2223]|nr:hypothetical protein BEL04_02855 [Mucilaginibacter sp. PPCGB 2223]
MNSNTCLNLRRVGGFNCIKILIRKFIFWALPAAGPSAHTAQALAARPVSAAVPNAVEQKKARTN